MKIKIDDLHYDYKFEHEYRGNTDCLGSYHNSSRLDDFCFLLNSFSEYERLLKCTIPEDLPSYKVAIINAKLKKIAEVKVMFKNLIDFCNDAASDTL